MDYTDLVHDLQHDFQIQSSGIQDRFSYLSFNPDDQVSVEIVPTADGLDLAEIRGTYIFRRNSDECQRIQRRFIDEQLRPYIKKVKSRKRGHLYHRLEYNLDAKSCTKGQINSFVKDLGKYIVYLEFLRDPEIVGRTVFPLANQLPSNVELDYRIKCCLRMKVFPTENEAWLHSLSSFWMQWGFMFKNPKKVERQSLDKKLIKQQCRAIVGIEHGIIGSYSNRECYSKGSLNNGKNDEHQCFTRPLIITTESCKNASIDGILDRIARLESSNHDLALQVESLSAKVDFLNQLITRSN